MNTALQELKASGFSVVRGCMSSAQCDAVLRDIDAFKTKHAILVAKNLNEFGHMYRVVNLHLVIDSVADAFAAVVPALQACDGFFGSPTSLYTTIYYERGSEQPLHRDSPYFSTRPRDKYLGAWLALDDVDDGNGPLQVMPESHALPDIDVEKIGRELFGDLNKVPASSPEAWDRYQAEVHAQCAERNLKPMNVHVRKGDVIIWHPLMLHGGAPHVDRKRSRKSLVMHLTPVGVPVYHMDVFFNPRRQVSNRAPWKYFDWKGRQIAAFDKVDFAHEYTANVSDLKRQ